MANPKKIKTINIAPTWKSAMSIYLTVLENGTEEGKRIAREELMKLAAEMDKVREIQKESE